MKDGKIVTNIDDKKKATDSKPNKSNSKPTPKKLTAKEQGRLNWNKVFAEGKYNAE